MITILKGVMVELNCRTRCGRENLPGRHFDDTDGGFVGSQKKVPSYLSALW